MKFLIINGVNLNMTGTREPDLYGSETLDDINAKIKALCDSFGDEVEFYQSNIEGEICEKLQNAAADAIIVNAGGYSHYSIAIRDAIAAIAIPTVEVHMTNIYAREEIRHHSVLSAVCRGTICGFGANSYLLAVRSFKC